jgi:hypothetical protein
MLLTTRSQRREWMKVVLDDWSEADSDEFGRLLEKFNLSIDKVVQGCADHES